MRGLDVPEPLVEIYLEDSLGPFRFTVPVGRAAPWTGLGCAALRAARCAPSWWLTLDVLVPVVPVLVVPALYVKYYCRPCVLPWILKLRCSLRFSNLDSKPLHKSAGNSDELPSCKPNSCVSVSIGEIRPDISRSRVSKELTQPRQLQAAPGLGYQAISELA